MSGCPKQLGATAKPVPQSKQSRCGLWLAAQRIGRETYCPVKDHRCDSCAYHVDLEIEPEIDVKKEVKEELLLKRRKAREAQRKWYQEHKSGRGPGRPCVVPKEARENPNWNTLYARLYARLKRAALEMPEGLRPVGTLQVAAALAPYILQGATELPDTIKVQDGANNVWHYDSSSKEFRCTSIEESAKRKVKAKRGQAG